jgi:hypothetical protein
VKSIFLKFFVGGIDNKTQEKQKRENTKLGGLP